jgi:hypothetical protein
MLGVDDRELADAEREQSIAHRGTGAARAELHNTSPSHVRQLAPEALGEAPPVGIVPDAPPIREHDGVCGSESFRIARELVESADHCLLARMRDVQAGKAEALRRRHEVRKGIDAETQDLQIDQLVEVAKPMLGALSLVQSGAAGRLDCASDEPDQHRRPCKRDGLGHRPSGYWRRAA